MDHGRSRRRQKRLSADAGRRLFQQQQGLRLGAHDVGFRRRGLPANGHRSLVQPRREPALPALARREARLFAPETLCENEVPISRAPDPGVEVEPMPLSEDEQRILQEIEAQFYANDPQLAQQVSETTLYRHASRNIKWAALG